MPTSPVPAVEGWFTTDDGAPRCSAPGARRAARCSSRAPGVLPQPGVPGPGVRRGELSRTRPVWSYTDARYQPPPPYIPPPEEHVPFALAAVELAEEQLVVLGQVGRRLRRRRPLRRAARWSWWSRRSTSSTASRTHLPLEAGGAHEHAREPSPSSGSGMHPWGKWGRNFVEYGVEAARAALADAGIAWSDVQFVAGADTIRNGYPGYVAGADLRPGARLERRPRRRPATPPAPRASPRSTPPGRGSSPGCATSPSWSAPTPRRRASSPRSPASGRTIRTGCASGCSAPPTPPTSRSTPAAAWTCTAPPTRTSPR